MIETAERKRPASISAVTWIMVVGSPITFATTIWTDKRPVIEVMSDIALIWLLACLLWRGYVFARWLVTVVAASSVTLNLASHATPSIWWLLRLLLPLTVLVLLWAPRGSRHWARQSSQADGIWHLVDSSLPDGYAAISILIELPTGPSAPLWKDGVPHVCIDGQDASPVAWGTSRFVMPAGAHDLHIHVALPVPKLPAQPGTAQRQLTLQEKSELFLRYAPPRIPTFHGQISLRKSPSAPPNPDQDRV